MSRLVRLLSACTPLHPFGRTRAARGQRSCRDQAPSASPSLPALDASRSQGAVAINSTAKRTAAVRPAPAHIAARSAVRVYRGASGMTMVGKIDAICRMIDSCIADERAALLSTAQESVR